MSKGKNSNDGYLGRFLKLGLLIAVPNIIVFSLIFIFVLYKINPYMNISINGNSLNGLKQESVRDYIIQNSDVIKFDDEELNSVAVSYDVDLSCLDNISFPLFIQSRFKPIDYNVKVISIIDDLEVTKWCADYNLYRAERAFNASIEKQLGEFIVVNSLPSTEIAVDDMIKDYVGKETGIIHLSDYYIDADFTTEEAKKVADEANKYVNWYCTYSNGEEVRSSIDYVEVVGEQIQVDTSFIDTQLADNYLSSYCNKSNLLSYDTYNSGTIEIGRQTWYNDVNYESEIEYLKEALNSGESVLNREPIMLNNFNNIPSTRIEVSIDQQHLWYFEDDILIMDSDVVTGYKGVHDTPKGVYFISEMIAGKWLTGDDYRTWVARWFRLNNNGIGLHDANWRSRFGGSVYTVDGSHGCINMPPTFAGTLFDRVKTQTCVIVF